MSASKVRDALGSETFDSYFKFCVIRNPYDKMVSRFWMDRYEELKCADKVAFDVVKGRFNSYILSRIGNLCDDRNVYTIHGIPIVDKFIRFERLLGDIADVCATLSIAFDPTALGVYKKGSAFVKNTIQSITIWIRGRPLSESSTLKSTCLITPMRRVSEFAWDEGKQVRGEAVICRSGGINKETPR